MRTISKTTGKAIDFAFYQLNLFRGCDHKCGYCFAPATTFTERACFDVVRLRDGLIDELRGQAPKFKDLKERVLLCFTCDPYPEAAGFAHVTRYALEILRDNNIPFTILTKGGTRACADFDIYGGNDIYSATLTFLTESKSREVEPNAALPSNRICALQEAHESGIWTEASLEPVMEVEETLAIIAATAHCVDLFKLGKLNYRKSGINWQQYGMMVINYLHDLGKPFFVKRDLAGLLHGIKYENMDTRMVQR